jgi:hypothetical protein
LLAVVRKQTQKPIIAQSKMQKCPCCKKQRSVAQFWDASKVPFHKYCGECRGFK